MTLLILSAIISSSEVAYFSLSKPEIEELKESDKVVWDLLQKPRKLLATILIFNNLVNVAFILLSTYFLHLLVDTAGWNHTDFQIWVVGFIEVGLITFLLLFFGEITPKILASQRRMLIVKKLALILRVLRTFFTPVSWFLINTTRFIDKRIQVNHETASFEDIKQAIDLTSEVESPEEEKEILKGIVDFSSTPVKSIMCSRVDVSAIEVTTSFDKVVDDINEFGYSRIPVYEEKLDKIKGILYLKDLIPLLHSEKSQPEWQALVRPAYFVPETKKIDDLLAEFKKMRLHIAVVVDEFGGTAGIVTLEDIIEEIFGEINDEFDNDDQVYSKLSEFEYVFDGKTFLDDLAKITGIEETIFDEARGDNDSLGGLILELMGKIPAKGEIITWKGFQFHIESVSKNRIKRVKIVLPSPFNEDVDSEA